MTVSIKQHFKHHPVQEEIELKRVMTALRDELDALYAKMDADFADVTNASTDYEATLSGAYLIP